MKDKVRSDNRHRAARKGNRTDACKYWQRDKVICNAHLITVAFLLTFLVYLCTEYGRRPRDTMGKGTRTCGQRYSVLAREELYAHTKKVVFFFFCS
jgi:hypothetical protein